MGLREHNLCYELCRQVTSTISSSFLQSFPPGSNRQSADYGSAALPITPEKHIGAVQLLSCTASEREQQDSNLQNRTLIVLESRWIGFEPITTASQTKTAAVKIPDRIYFSALYQVELPSAIENVGFEPLLCVPNAACCSLHHILISCSSGNRTRASGETVRCTGRYTMKPNIRFLFYYIQCPPCEPLRRVRVSCTFAKI